MSLKNFTDAVHTFLLEAGPYVDADEISRSMSPSRLRRVSSHRLYKEVLSDVVAMAANGAKPSESRTVFVKDDRGVLANVKHQTLLKDIKSAVYMMLDGLEDSWAAEGGRRDQADIDEHAWLQKVKSVSAKAVKSPRTGSKGFKITFK